MLIRLVADNFLSFGKSQEFNTIPNPRLKTLNHHKYKINDFDILKISSIYGANGAGKSNLINCLKILQQLAIGNSPDLPLSFYRFKLDNNTNKQTLASEFISDDQAFYYAIEIIDDIIATEELYLSGLGKNADELVYERKTDTNKNTTITFLPDFENDEKSQVLKSILLEEFVEPNKTILKLLAKRDNQYLKVTRLAYKWFRENLQIITPKSRPTTLAHRIDTESNFKKYAEDIMCSFNIGITSLAAEKKELKTAFSEDRISDYEQLKKKIDESPQKMVGLRSDEGGSMVVVEEDNNYWIKQLQILHKGHSNESVPFELEEESDGTIRLLDFVPAFHHLINDNKVFVIDEIERSIHPLLIKELVKKFSLDESSKGQLLFTTHEANLLDQEIFRQDEIWFSEKDNSGSTELYSLSDFKEHKTIDISKGYLSGRYGSIPFLGNLKDLNWHQYDLEK